MKIGISGKMTAGKTSMRMYLEKNYGFVGIAFADPIKKLEKIHSSSLPQVWEGEVSQFMDSIVESKVHDLSKSRWKEKISSIILQCFHDNEPMPGVKNRRLLQSIGNGLRKIDENIWLNCLLYQIKKMDNVVVDDVRYLNELYRLKQEGFQMWRIEVTPETQRDRIIRLYGEENLNYIHDIGEVQLDDELEQFDYIICGNVPLEEMYEAGDFLIGEHAPWLKRKAE